MASEANDHADPSFGMVWRFIIPEYGFPEKEIPFSDSVPNTKLQDFMPPIGGSKCHLHVIVHCFLELLDYGI